MPLQYANEKSVQIGMLVFWRIRFPNAKPLLMSNVDASEKSIQCSLWGLRIQPCLPSYFWLSSISNLVNKILSLAVQNSWLKRRSFGFLVTDLKLIGPTKKSCWSSSAVLVYFIMVYIFQTPLQFCKTGLKLSEVDKVYSSLNMMRSKWKWGNIRGKISPIVWRAREWHGSYINLNVSSILVAGGSY